MLLTIEFGVLLLFAALIVFWLANRQRRSTGLPSGRVIYSDTNRWDKVEKPLYDPISGLTGKPDYLVEENELLIPIEVKSSRAPTVPHDSHVYQLAAYCLLVERTYHKRPPYGILRYRDRTFSIDYTAALEQELENLLDAIRLQTRRGEANRSHQEPARCSRCGYRDYCDQRL
jgi:CRISPR-associated exonuclease Cas4